MEKGNLNLQAHTPATSISERDANGWITVKTDRGTIRTRAVVHTTNRWASHLLPEFNKLIMPNRGVVVAIKAPPGFIKHTGAQHWDSRVNVRISAAHFTEVKLMATAELSPPAPSALQHHPHRRRKTAPRPQSRRLRPQRRRRQTHNRRSRLLQILARLRRRRLAQSQPCRAGHDRRPRRLLDRKYIHPPLPSRSKPTRLTIPPVETSSADGFPFVGPVPTRAGHFIAAGFAGHGTHPIPF